jgi:hypothetical protein
MWQTCALLIALTTAGAPVARVAPLQGEPPRAFLCRAAHLPEGRACAARCDRAFAGPGQADAGWDCLVSCSRRAQHAIADCRRSAEPAPATPLAAR